LTAEANHRRHKGVFFWPHQCFVDSLNGSAIVYAPQTYYRLGSSSLPPQWVDYSDLESSKGETREMLHKSDKVMYYAGTFEASKEICECGPEEYRNLSEEVRFVTTLYLHMRAH
jgi:hypothetical protein